MLPRGLDVLFNSISGKQWPGMDLKPKLFNSVVKLSPDDEEKEKQIKEKTMRLNSRDVSLNISLFSDVAKQFWVQPFQPSC